MFLQAKNGFIVGKSYPDESPNLTNIEVGDEWKNIPLFHDDFPFIFLYKCIDGEVLPRGQEEIDADIAARPAPPPTEDARIRELETNKADKTELDALNILLRVNEE